MIARLCLACALLVSACTVKTSEPPAASRGADAGPSTGTGTGTGATSVALTKCNALCDAQGKATECRKAPDAAGCKSICAPLAESLSADCRPKAEKYYDCASKQSWTCLDDQGEALAQADANACATELQTYSACAR